MIWQPTKMWILWKTRFKKFLLLHRLSRSPSFVLNLSWKIRLIQNWFKGRVSANRLLSHNHRPDLKNKRRLFHLSAKQDSPLRNLACRSRRPRRNPKSRQMQQLRARKLQEPLRIILVRRAKGLNSIIKRMPLLWIWKMKTKRKLGWDSPNLWARSPPTAMLKKTPELLNPPKARFWKRNYWSRLQAFWDRTSINFWQATKQKTRRFKKFWISTDNKSRNVKWLLHKIPTLKESPGAEADPSKTFSPRTVSWTSSRNGRPKIWKLAPKVTNSNLKSLNPKFQILTRTERQKFRNLSRLRSSYLPRCEAQTSETTLPMRPAAFRLTPTRTASTSLERGAFTPQISGSRAQRGWITSS